MNIAIIFAGGVGARMGTSSAVPKQFLEIHGKPIIIHTLEHFDFHPEIDAIAVAILPEWREHLTRLIRRYDLDKVRWIVDGGPTGQESRLLALTEVSRHCDGDTLVMLHDGVRPLIDANLITANLAAARVEGSAVTCKKINETVVESPSAQIDGVYPREHLYSAQAPQTFRLEEVLDVYTRADEENREEVDSCSLMLKYGRSVHRIVGPDSNIKITTAQDFYVCRAFFDLIEQRQIAGAAV